MIIGLAHAMSVSDTCDKTCRAGDKPAVSQAPRLVPGQAGLYQGSVAQMRSTTPSDVVTSTGDVLPSRHHDDPVGKQDRRESSWTKSGPFACRNWCNRGVRRPRDRTKLCFHFDGNRRGPIGVCATCVSHLCLLFVCRACLQPSKSCTPGGACIASTCNHMSVLS